MSAYSGRHAQLYDTFYGEKPYKEEAAFVHDCLQKHGEGPILRLLELACGTGSHSFALEQLGYSVLATDNSADMLRVARQKAIERGSSVEFRSLDMRDLDLPESQFDAAICLFDSIGYVLTNEGLISTLKGIHRSLRAGGLLVMEFWHAGAMLRKYDPVRVRRWKAHGGEILRLSETTLDHFRQSALVRYTVYELRSDGTYTSFQETQQNRYFQVQEMSGWLSMAGFEPVEWFDGYTGRREITDNAWHVLVVARRPVLRLNS